MNKKIKEYLLQNEELIYKKIEFAVRSSADVSESGSNEDEKIRIVLTNDFEIKTIRSNDAYTPEWILYVIAEIDCETYIVEFSDIENYLNIEELKRFKTFILANGELKKAFLSENCYEIDELSEDELLIGIKHYIDSQCQSLEYLQLFDAKIHDEFLKSIYENFNNERNIDFAKNNIGKDLIKY